MTAKVCGYCKKLLPAAMFNNDKRTSDGLLFNCKPCARERKLRTKYGINQAQFENMFLNQLRACAICKTTTPRGRNKFVIDHNHATGKVRSILCGNCNTGIGQFNDSIEMVQAALDYLRSHADI